MQVSGARGTAQGSWSAVAALACGCALALALPALVAPPEGREAGCARWVVADRDGAALVLLDDDLMLAGRLPVPWPTHARARPAGGFWVVSATQGHPRAGQRLRLLGAPGQEPAELELPPAIDLEIDALGRALLLVRAPAGATLVLKASPGVIEERFEVGCDARSLAPGGSQLGVAAGREGLLVLDEAGHGRRRAPSGATSSVLDAAALGEGAWVVLERGDSLGSERVLVLDEDLRVTHQTSCPGAERLAVGPGPSGAVWVIESAGRWVRRIHPRPRQGPELVHLPALGASAAQVDSRGGLVLAAPGAILRVSLEGEAEAGQGGFVRLTDIAAVTPP